jgi:hypothetical protein
MTSQPASDQPHHPARAVIAAGICEWNPDEYADWEGEDLADVMLEALAEAGYVVVKEGE